MGGLCLPEADKLQKVVQAALPTRSQQHTTADCMRKAGSVVLQRHSWHLHDHGHVWVVHPTSADIAAEEDLACTFPELLSHSGPAGSRPGLSRHALRR